MRYLRTYENMIKHTDKSAVNHPLNAFSMRLEMVIIRMSKSIGTVMRYFIEDGRIMIKYYNNNGISEILTIYLSYDNSYDKVKIELKFSTFEFNQIESFVEFFRVHTNKYNILDKPYRIVIKFPLSKVYDVLELIEDYYVQLDGDKYNL